MENIAIIGIGCLFPGADNPEKFWQNLWDNRDLTSLLSEKELGRDPIDYFDPEPAKPDKICFLKNGYIRDFKFDPHGYRIDPNELMTLDNLFLWSLYAAKEAIKDSQYLENETLLKNCGIISGNLSFPTSYSKQIFLPIYMKTIEPYVQELLQNQQFRFNAEYNSSGISPYNIFTASFPTTITAKALGLQGPCYAIDAACSSALYCVKLAGYYLNTGKADIMLAGAVCGPEHIFVSHGFNMLQASPPEHGKSIPLDQSSQGLNIGEGAGFFVLKRYSDAVRDKDKIYAIVENVGLSNDGGAQHILMPDKQGQLLALERAYKNRSKRVDYIECHATGTPLGDRVEIDTLESFFEDTDFPLFGANKAGIGHSLTASGMASMIKVVLSMKKGMIPATIGLKEPVKTKNQKIQLKHIVVKNIAWPKKDKEKRAGINAFGFGGTNAHIIFKEHTPGNQSSSVSIQVKEKDDIPLAIIGMSARFGDIDNLDAFFRTVYNDTRHFKPLPCHRWIGAEENQKVLKQYGFETGTPPKCAYFEQDDIDCIKSKLPPKMINLHLASHLFMTKIARKAYDDAGLDLSGKHEKTAVIIALETNLVTHCYLTRCEIHWQLRESLEKCNIKLDKDRIKLLENILKDSLFPIPYFEGVTGGIGNLAASRIASTLGFKGPVFTIASQENSIFKAIELAGFFLAFGNVDTVVTGGLDMAAGWENVLSRNRLYKNKTKGFYFGEGGGAIVLKRYEDAKKDLHRIYSVARSIDIVQKYKSNNLNPSPCSEGVYKSCKNALSKADIKPSDVQYIELHKSGIKDEDLAELKGISRAYCFDNKTGKTALGSIKANIGHTFSVSGIASIIKTSLCLYNRFIPTNSQKEKKANHLGIANLEDKDKKLFAAVNCLGTDSSYSHLILSEPDKDDRVKEKEFKSELKKYQDKNKNRKKFIKRLLNGGPRIRDMILKKEHIKKFQTKTSIPFVVLSTAKKNRPLSSAKKVNNRSGIPFVLMSTAEKKTGQVPRAKSKNIIWDESDIIEMTNGMVSKILGPDYRKTDSYPVRARMPSPPFMFATRVTKMTAKKGEFKPYVIEWEYDIPKDAEYAVYNVVPMIIPFEASHTLILGLSYIGCDKIFEGKLRYRVIDSKVYIYDDILAPEPAPGDIFCGQVKITSFVKTRSNLLIFYEFNGFVKNIKLFTIYGTSGLFSQSDMKKSKGLPSVYKPDLSLKTKRFIPLLNCKKTKFIDLDINHLQAGDFQKCFGSNYKNQKSFVLGSPKFLMLDRIISIDRHGGNFGLGLIIGEKDIEPNHWIFKAHFKNDPVLPGTMIIAGVYQVLLFYMCYLGLHTHLRDCRPSVVPNSTSNVRFRGEIKQISTSVRYRVIIKKIKASDIPYVIADAEVIHNDKVIGICENFGSTFVSANSYNQDKK